MNHNAIFISNYGAGKASVVKLDEQSYNQFTSPNDAEFGKFKKAYADGKLGVMPTPSTLNSRTLLDKVLSSTDPDLQGELEGLSFRVARGREKYGTEDELYDDGTTDYVVLTAQDGEEKAIRLLEVLKSDVVDFTGLPRWTGGKPGKELGSAGFCARALAKAYQNRGHIVYSPLGYVGNGEPAKAVACMCPSGLVALGVIYQPPEVGTWGEDKSMTDIHDAKFDNFFSGEPVGGGEKFYNDVDAFKKVLGNPMQGAEG